MVVSPPVQIEAGALSFEAAWWGRIPAQAWSEPLHAHPQIELIRVLAGGGTVDLPDGPRPVAPGCLLVLPAGLPHRLSCSPGAALAVSFLGFSVRPVAGGGGTAAGREEGARLRRLLSPRPWIVRGAEGGLAGALFDALARELEERREGWKAGARAAAAALLHALARRLSEPLPASPDRRPAGAWTAVSLRPSADLGADLPYAAAQQIALRFREPLRIEDVAAALGCGVRRLQRAFHAVGFRFRDSLRDMRLVRALSLLAATRRPIERVARQSGFAHHTYFTRAFRERYGMTPRRFRSLVRGG
jgi:AraC-like DNA-binding protein